MEIKDCEYSFINEAMENLGEAFDYAKNVYNINMDSFMDMFIVSGYSKMFENGDDKVLYGMSGSELVLNVFNKIEYKVNILQPKNNLCYTKEYWCGWILAYYQYKTKLSFKYIHSKITMEEILSLYPTLHEASEDKFVDVLNKRIKSRINTSRLQEMRKNLGLSQKDLADKSGVNLRTLQQYELKTKDINKASVSSVYALSKVLCCGVEDLLEVF